MIKTHGLVVAVNPGRRIGVVRVGDARHAVIGHGDDHELRVGDLLRGDFGTEGSTMVQNVNTGEVFDAHNHFVDSSFDDASTFAS